MLYGGEGLLAIAHKTTLRLLGQTCPPEARFVHQDTPSELWSDFHPGIWFTTLRAGAFSLHHTTDAQKGMVFRIALHNMHITSLPRPGPSVVLSFISPSREDAVGKFNSLSLSL